MTHCEKAHFGWNGMNMAEKTSDFSYRKSAKGLHNLHDNATSISTAYYGM